MDDGYKSRLERDRTSGVRTVLGVSGFLFCLLSFLHTDWLTMGGGRLTELHSFAYVRIQKNYRANTRKKEIHGGRATFWRYGACRHKETGFYV